MSLVLNGQEHIVRAFNFYVDFEYTLWIKNNLSCIIFKDFFVFEDGFGQNHEFERKESEK